jgi:RNA polymerase sigma factor (sigma-70 family)
MTLAVEGLERDIAAALAARDLARPRRSPLKVTARSSSSILRSLMRDDDLTNEAFSRLCEKVWRTLPDFRGESSFATWRTDWPGTRRGEVKRGLARRRERRFESGELSQVEAQVRETTAAYLRTETKDRWAKLREDLDAEERSLLLLRIERRLPWKDIAAVMADEPTGATEAALRKRFERMR